MTAQTEQTSLTPASRGTLSLLSPLLSFGLSNKLRPTQPALWLGRIHRVRLRCCHGCCQQAMIIRGRRGQLDHAARNPVPGERELWHDMVGNVWEWCSTNAGQTGLRAVTVAVRDKRWVR